MASTRASIASRGKKTSLLEDVETLSAVFYADEKLHAPQLQLLARREKTDFANIVK